MNKNPETHPTTANLFDAAAACLAEPDPERKQALVARTAADWAAGKLALDAAGAGPAIDHPGRPDRPALVPPRDLARRRLSGWTPI